MLVIRVFTNLSVLLKLVQLGVMKSRYFSIINIVNLYA